MARLLCLLCLLLCLTGCTEERRAAYTESQAAFANPLTGFAPWFSGVDALPGDAQMVYIPISWRELEPEEGVFAWADLEEKYQLSTLRQRGYHLVLRFLCDKPDKEPHRDIPGWLYDKTADGVDYHTDYGWGYCPNYENPVFLLAHEAAVAALGRQLGGDTFVSFVELGSLGHWGEWHIKGEIMEMPDAQIQEAYVAPWIEAFPKAKLLMRRPFTHAGNHGLGLYNDMAGHEDATAQWLDWIRQGGEGMTAMEDAWKNAPIGGELTSSLTMENLLEENLPKTLKLLEESHTTFLGPMVPSEKYPEGRKAVLKAIGYRIRISEAVLSRNSGKNTLHLTWENTGIAPMYFDWPVQVYLEDPNRNTLETYLLDLSLTQLLPGTTLESEIPIKGSSLITKLDNHSCRITIGIVDPMTGRDAVRLAMDAPFENGRTVLFD